MRAKGIISNIGALGVFIEAESQLPVGTRLKLRFLLPDDQIVEAEGVIAHRQTGVGVGVAFVAVGAETMKRINRFLSADRE